MTRWTATPHRGIRYREHPTRRHGIRPDRYFTLRLAVDGRMTEEGLGWASDGWTLERAALEVARLRSAGRTGAGPVTLAAARSAASAERSAQAAAEMTLGQYFTAIYLPACEARKKPSTTRCERQTVEKHFADLLAKRFDELGILDFERAKRTMAKAGAAPRTIEYTLGILRHVWTLAARDGYAGPPPAGAAKVRRFDNRRQRYLTTDEARRLLAALRRRSEAVADMAILALYTGMRAGEILRLTWADVDLEADTLTLRDTKSGRTRIAYLPARARAVFTRRRHDAMHEHVFTRPGRPRGRPFDTVSDTFQRTVEALGLNADATDRRHRVTFHTLRHTYASRLVAAGVDLYVVKELLGHSTIALTERYSHVGEDARRAAVRRAFGGLKAI